MSAVRLLVAGLAGLLFGFGLAISGMLDPTRVRGFLDIAGSWDPSLAFVLGGAVAVAGLGTLLKRRLDRPLLASQFHLPDRSRIDPPLLAGAALFGIGWGMAGLCPGPAIADLALLRAPVLIFVAAMALGMFVFSRLGIGR